MHRRDMAPLSPCVAIGSSIKSMRSTARRGHACNCRYETCCLTKHHVDSHSESSVTLAQLQPAEAAMRCDKAARARRIDGHTRPLHSKRK
eukprot:scaffold11155_cov141-Isochrysis_galbana.AAC.4